MLECDFIQFNSGHANHLVRATVVHVEETIFHHGAAKYDVGDVPAFSRASPALG